MTRKKRFGKVSLHAIEMFRLRVLVGLPLVRLSDKEIKKMMWESMGRIDCSRFSERRVKIRGLVRLGETYYLVRMVMDAQWGGIVTCLGLDPSTDGGLIAS